MMICEVPLNNPKNLGQNIPAMFVYKEFASREMLLSCSVSPTQCKKMFFKMSKGQEHASDVIT